MTVKTEDKKKVRTQLIAVFIAAILFLTGFWYIQTFMKQEKVIEAGTSEFAKAEVTELLQDKTQIDMETEGIRKGSQDISIEIKNGTHKGEIHTITNYMSALYNIDCQKGTKIIVRINTLSSGDAEISVYNYDREGYLIGAVVLFMLALVVIGGKKGFMSLISLFYTLLNVFVLLIPALYYGAPVLATTVLVLVITNLMCFVMIDGINKKTICAAMGTTAGVVTAGVFAFVLGRLTHISGFQTNEAEELLLVCSDYGLKVRYLFTAGILVSALGAVMDVAMSISSAIHEVHSVNPALGRKELFRSGMNIGRDAMGTMANTLILAFVGSSINLIIMIYSYNIPFTQLFATDLVAREIIQGLSGSIGIIMTVPMVALIGAFMMHEKGNGKVRQISRKNTCIL